MPSAEEIAANLRALEKEYAGQEIAQDASQPWNAITHSNAVRYSLSGLGKILDVLDTGLNAVTVGLRPVVTGLNPELEKVYQKFEKQTGAFGLSNITPSALIEEAIPGKHWYKGPIKFAADVAADPLTYLTFGTETAAGQVLSKARSLGKAKEVIKFDSKLAGELADLYGESRPLANTIRIAKQSEAPKSLAEAARTGERALVQYHLPGLKPFKLVTGEPVFKVIDTARQFVRASKYGKTFRTLFSTATNNPEFDQMEKMFVNVLQYRKGEVNATAKAITDQADELAVKLGLSREVFDKIVTDVVEKPTKTQRIIKKVVTRVAPEATEIKQRLVNALRGIGESKAADFWEKKAIWDKDFQAVVKDFKTEGSPVARFMQHGETLGEVSSYLAPLKRLVKDVAYWNSSKVGKSEFASMISNKVLRVAFPLDTVEVNSSSKYLREAYKALPQGSYSEIYQKVGDLINADLVTHKVSTKDVIQDLYHELPQKLLTTKPQIPLGKIQTSFGEVKPGSPQLNKRTVTKLSQKLDRLGIKEDPTNLLVYYSHHFFRPTITYSPIEQIVNKSGTTAIRNFQLIRKGQLADILKQNRGDVYDRINFLTNEGIIDNRHLLPSTGLLNTKAIYNDQEVLVRRPILDPQKGLAVIHETIPREEFEREISETKKLIYATKQILPVVHGTNPKVIEAIMQEGIKPVASVGANTKVRDITAGVAPKVFATTPFSDYGEIQVLLPTSLLEKASALPGDGLYLPANPMITKYLLTKGQDGIMEMALRRLAIWDWGSFQGLSEELRGFPGLHDTFARRLAGLGINTPDIHLTGPISPKDFVKVYSLPTGGSLQKQIVKMQDLVGDQLSRIQLIQKGERYFTRFIDPKGNPLVDWELRGTPNLAALLSKINVAGVPIDAEKQAAVIEKLIGKAKIPQGESMFTYLRKTQPQLFAPKIEVLDRPEYLKQLDNYGLLSDESIDTIAANILDIREGIYGKGLSAQEVLETPLGILTSKRILVNQEQFSKAINDIPGINTMPIEERNKLVRNYWRQIKAHERGHDVFNLGLRQLPQEIVDEFADEVGILSKMSLRGISTGGKFIKARQLSSILKAFSNGGEEDAIQKLIGQKGWNRIKNNPQDYQFMKSVIHKLVAHVDEIFSEAHSMYNLNPKGLQRRWPQGFGIMQKIYQRKGWKTEWITETTQIPRKWAVKYPEIFDFAQRVRGIQNEMNEQEVNWGLQSEKSTGKFPIIRPVITKPVREFLQAKLFKGARVWNDQMEESVMKRFRNLVPSNIDNAVKAGWLKPADAFKLRKEKGLQYMDKLRENGVYSHEQLDSLLYQLTHNEVNALARAGKLKLLAGHKVDQFFELDPAAQIRVRGIEGARARTSVEFFQASKQFGLFKKVPEPGYKFVKADSLAGWQFPEEIADHLDRYHETIKLPTGMHPLLDLFDDTQNLWKAWTLSIFPAYHTRNVVGNFWNNFLGGVVDPRLYRMGWDLVHGNPVNITTGYGKVYNAEQLIQLAKEHDLWKIGQTSRDIEELFEKELKGGLLLKARDNGLLRAGRELGIYFEVQAYMAHFIHKLEQGYSPGAAAQSVKKYLFDYGDLTSFEKNVMKRIFPFYTWTRKNIPLQLEALMTQPGKPLGVFKFKNAMESSADGTPDERYLPDWMVQNFPIRTRRDPKSGNFEYFLLGSWLPLADIDKLFHPERLITNMLTPLLKEPMEQLINKDFFSGKEVDRGGEYDRFVGVNLPKRLSHVLRNIRVLNELDKLTSKDTSITGKLVGIATGKLYPLDIKKQKRFYEQRVQEQERNINSQLARARKKGDKGEVQRVLRMAKRIQEERVRFKRGQ